VSRRVFDPFGSKLDEDTTGQPTVQRFGGQRQVENIGLYDFQARWYDASTGRFLQTDPIVETLAEPATVNAYGYVRNNPTSFIDPTGRQATGVEFNDRGDPVLTDFDDGVCHGGRCLTQFDQQLSTLNQSFGQPNFTPVPPNPLQFPGFSPALGSAVALSQGSGSWEIRAAEPAATIFGYDLYTTTPVSDFVFPERRIFHWFLAAEEDLFVRALSGQLEEGEQFAMVVPGGPQARWTLREAKQLLAMWGKGSFDTIAASVRYHAARHGAGDVWTYLRQAANFNRRGAHVVTREGSTLYRRKSGEFLIEREGKIVSYGRE